MTVEREDTMDTYLTYSDVAERTGVSINTLRVWLHRGKLPEPDYKPNARVVLWKPETIDAWEKERGHDGLQTD